MPRTPAPAHDFYRTVNTMMLQVGMTNADLAETAGVHPFVVDTYSRGAYTSTPRFVPALLGAIAEAAGRLPEPVGWFDSLDSYERPVFRLGW